jgi:hypothetical protein
MSPLPTYFFGGSFLRFIDVCVLLACGYVVAFSPCLCSLYLGEMLCLVKLWLNFSSVAYCIKEV